MTVRQIVQWVEAFNDSTLARFKEQAQLLSGQAQQIISGMGALIDKKNKFLTLEKLYPNLFGDTVYLSDLPPEEAARREALAWRAFLGV